LLNKSGRPVQLTLNDKPSWEGSHQTSYKPITQERSLIYLEWVTRNREYVAKATTGEWDTFTFRTWAAAGIRAVHQILLSGRSAKKD